MAEITGWGRSGWGTDGWGTPDDINVTGNQVAASVGSVTVTARKPELVNVTGAQVSLATSSVTASAGADITITTTDPLTVSEGTSNVYGLIVTGQTTDWREVA